MITNAERIANTIAHIREQEEAIACLREAMQAADQDLGEATVRGDFDLVREARYKIRDALAKVREALGREGTP